MMRDHKDWTVWQKAIDLVSEIYKITKIFPFYYYLIFHESIFRRRPRRV